MLTNVYIMFFWAVHTGLLKFVVSTANAIYILRLVHKVKKTFCLYFLLNTS